MPTNFPSPRTGIVERWLEAVAGRAANPGRSILDMLSQAYGYQGTPEMQQAFSQVPAQIPEGLPVGMGGFPVMGGIMAGPKAANAPLDMLDIAMQAEAKGMPKERIMDATGWFKGADDKWRFEIDDSAMRLAPGSSGFPGGYTDAVEHPTMRQAYGEQMEDIPTVWGYGDRSGSFAPTDARGGYGGIRATGKDDKEVISVLSHEGQHGVQDIEGFARGGSPDSFVQEYKNSEDIYQSLIDYANDLHERYMMFRLGKPKGLDSIKTRIEFDDEIREADKMVSEARAELEKLDPNNRYKRLAGETEARNVQSRLNLSPDDRRMLYPWLTEDVPILDQLVRFGNGKQASIDDAKYLWLDVGSGSKFRAPKRVEIVKNPTPDDYQRISSEVRREYPDLMRGEPTTRFTIDEDGNRYIWKSYDGVHAFVEPEIQKRIGKKVSQNMDLY